MEKRNYETLNAIAIAFVGASVVTSFAVSQGQHPLVGGVISLIATAFTVAGSRSGLF